MKTRIVLVADFPAGEREDFVRSVTDITRARVAEIRENLQHISDSLELGMKFSVAVEEFKQGPRCAPHAWRPLQ
jgi:hypothetical protein